MPFSADAFALYVSLRRIVSPLPALRTKEYCPLSFWLSTYHPAMNASLLREVPPPDSAAAARGLDYHGALRSKRRNQFRLTVSPGEAGTGGRDGRATAGDAGAPAARSSRAW